MAMPSKRKETVEDKFPRKAVNVKQGDTERETARNYAEMITSPELATYRVINGADAKTGLNEQLDVPALMAVIRKQADVVEKGDLKQLKSMLVSQATALQTLFARLAERAMTCDQVPGFEANMKMALRSQAQCRATLETLGTLMNPPIVYARQANVTSGPQQINNGVSPRARENETKPIKQSGASNELLPHTRAPSLARRDDTAMETVGEIDRGEVSRG